jgi:hypothetical protein
MHMNKPEPDATKMSKVAGVASGAVEVHGKNEKTKAPKIGNAGT